MTQIHKVEINGRTEEFTNQLSAAAYAKKHGGRLIANSEIDNITATDQMPVRNPGLCNLLGLSTTALNTPDEIKTAFEANGRKSSPADFQKIASALADFWMTKRGMTRDDTIQFLRKRHPLLFAGSLAETTGTTNEKPGVFTPKMAQEYLSNSSRLAANECLATGPTMKF